MTIVDRLPPRISENYEILREIGRGGMATVYLARDLKHGRDVAVKVLHPELVAATDFDRFQREIRISATLQHPHILPLFDSGRANDLVYFVMPFVDGESLRDRIRRERQLPIAEAVRIARRIADALGYAHERHIVHRDIKPENILLSGDNVYVADFGVARALGVGDGGLRTNTGVAVGTPYYMSPEQATADTSLDGRSDIYALGCVLYEMLAGEPPFTGPSLAAVIARHVQAKVPQVTIVRPTVPEFLERAIETAMHKSPADRFQTAGEFALALDESAAARQAVSTSGFVRGTPRDRLEAARSARSVLVRRTAIAAAALALTAAGWFSWSRWLRPADLDPDLLFVAPFNVQEGLAVEWRDGLVTLVARNLDGAGVLRAVDPARFLLRWTDQSSGTAVARSFGAGLSVAGTVTRAGGDSVRIRATVRDELSKQSLPDVEVYGPAARIDQVSDSLSIALLGVLAPLRNMGAVQLTSLRASLPAIKAFLRGEQWSRQAVYDSAAYYFLRATKSDSSFALAFQRLFFINSHRGVGDDTQHREYGLRAGQLNRGLAPRESLLVVIDSLQAALELGRFSDDTTRSVLTRRLFAAFDVATLNFRTDSEVRVRLGYALYSKIDPTRDPSQSLALEAFDQAIALDSTFAPAYIYAIELSMRLNGYEDAMRHVRAYLRLDPRGVDADGMLLFAKLAAKQYSEDEITAMLKEVSSAAAFSALQPAYWWPDSMETSVHLARHILSDPKRGADLSPSPEWARSVLARTLAWRGHAEAAFAMREDVARRGFLVPLLAVPGAPVSERATASAVQFLRRSLWPPNELPELLPLWQARADTTALQVVATRADSLARSAASPPARAYARHLADAASAYHALARGDSAAALSRFLLLSDSSCPDCAYDKVTRVRLLRSRGRNAEATRLLTGVLPNEGVPVAVLWRLERARAAADAGDRARALREYQFVASIWRNADAHVQPLVREAQAYLLQHGAR